MNSSVYHNILDYLRQTIDATEWTGKVYAVGGCCRDLAMGNEIKDIDLAVEIPNGGIKFAKWLHSQGKTARKPIYYPMFGTAMLSLDKYPDEEIEIVQTRKGKYTADSRDCPEAVFGNVVDDCLMRDLTINSLYYNITTGETLDITGNGIGDIDKQILRTPVEPDLTYTDDPLRVLRTIRFATRLGWKIDRRLYAAMCRHVSELPEVSPRRLGAEVIKILNGTNPRLAMELLAETGVLKTLMPELEAMMNVEKETGSKESVWEHTIKVLEATPPETELRLAALFHDVGKPRVRTINKKGIVVYNNHEATSGRSARVWMKHLKMGRDFTITVEYIVRNHDIFRLAGSNLDVVSDKKLINIAGSANSRNSFDMLIEFIKANNIANDMQEQNAAIDSRIETLFKNYKIEFGRATAQTEHKSRRRHRGRNDNANKRRNKGYRRRRN
ncbi:MAG: CCA tRNA nucleotidyltransferase [Muribaculaceae bacterium]|nr:CCA tRNA nucleotidyltransferase [Muribaculaceae bacterium]